MRHFVFRLCALSLACLTGCCLPPRKAALPFYPIGIYAVSSATDFKTVKNSGFNLVVDRANKDRLDAAQAAGLKVLAAPNASAGPAFNPAVARKAVHDFDRHPALWAWYLVDEPDLNGVSPPQVDQAHRCVKNAGATKPTALVLYQGYEALYYGNIADITMIDRYPIPWLPLANFGQHVTTTRLALGRNKPLIAVIQAFDWSSCPEMLPGERDFRPPTYAEIRCMTYEALARGANGLFYFAFDTGRWKIQEHPETWYALTAVVKEVNERLPLFQARPQWWPKNHRFGDPAHRFNAAIESSVSSALVRVSNQNRLVPAGDYIVAVNNTELRQLYSFMLPPSSPQAAVPVLGEGRAIEPRQMRIEDSFDALGVHVYGPLE